MGRGRASTVTTPFDLEKYFRKDREQKNKFKNNFRK